MLQKLKRIIACCMLMVLGLLSTGPYVQAEPSSNLNEREPMYISYKAAYNDFPVYVNDPNKVYSVKCDASWLGIYNPNNQKGNAKFLIMPQENTTGYARTANISIVFDEPDAYDKNTTFQIIQKAEGDEHDPVHVEQLAGWAKFEIKLEQNEYYTVSSDYDWINLEPYPLMGGETSKTFYFSYDENIYNYERIGYIDVHFPNKKYNEDYRIKVIQDYVYIKNRSNKIICLGDKKFNPVGDNASVFYDDKVYLDTVLPLMFKVDNLSKFRIEVPQDSQGVVSLTNIPAKEFDGTLCYRINFAKGQQPQVGNKLLNAPRIIIYVDDICINVYFRNFILEKDPNVTTTSSTSSGTLPYDYPTYTYKNGSQLNWDYMQEYIKKWPNV